MHTYYYKVRDRSGDITEGSMEADTQEDVAKFLMERSLAVITISQQGSSSINLKNLSIFNHVPTKELVIFFRQLAIMIESNLPLVRALRILSRQTSNRRLQDVIASMSTEIEGGSSFSGAMALYDDVFSNFFINIIRSGETSGRLSEVLQYLADQKEKDYDLESKIKGAMIYPIVIFCALVVVAIVVLTYVIPTISGLLKESGAQLPLITVILIGVSDFVKNYIILLIIAAIIAGAAWASYIRTPHGRRFYDELKLKIPIFGEIFRNTYVVRFCLSFATLIKGGVPVVQALDIVREAVDNKVFEEILVKAVAEIDEGSQISEALANYEEIPAIVIQMIKVGEESGKLDEVLTSAAGFYTREIENASKNLSTLLEPLIMIVMGIGVAVFVIAVYVPMWQLSSSFGG